VAQTGEEAWEILRVEDPPRIALMDWMMPGMDGVEVCRRLREADGTRLIYVIMVTTNAQNADIVAGLEAGADDYITKPFDLGELRARFDVGVRMIDLQARLAERERALGAARARLAEEERLHATVASMTDGIVIADGDWRITFANRSSQLLLGLGEDWQGAPLETSLAGYELSVPLEELRTATDAGTAVEIARTRTDVSLYLDGNITRRFDEDGRLTDLVLALRDVTVQRAARNVEANFLNSVSHKLRTPLAVLRGYLGIMSSIPEDRMGVALEQMLPVCVREAERLQEMVERLLQFRELSLEEQREAAEPLDVTAEMDRIRSIMHERYPEKQVDVSVDRLGQEGALPLICGHAGLILEELADNAAKFATAPTVRVQVQVRPSEGGFLEMSVTDDGPGIPPEYLDRVLDGYVQVGEHVTGQIPGFGLGLRIVKDVVEACGGEITVRSGSGGGTSVTLRLPVAARGARPA
jgi:signal transduction histidine kinase